MKTEMLDPNLTEQIKQVGEKGQVEAVLLVDREATHTSSGIPCSADGSTGPAFVERISQHLHEQPTSVRCLPNLGVVVVRGSGNLVQHLLDADEVVSATSSESSGFVAASHLMER